MKRATGFFAIVLFIIWGAASACPAQEPTDEIVVEVTAPKEEPPAAGPSRPTQVISSGQIDSQGDNNVAQAIEQAPGVDLSAYGSSSAISLVHLRGASPDQVLILLNGQRLNTLQGGGVDLARLSTLAIERIEVSRGTASSRFGADALGGIVNIITKSGENAPRLTYSTEVGSFGGRRGAISTSSKSQRSDYFLAFDRSYSEGDFPFTAPDGSIQRRYNAGLSSHSIFSTLGYYLAPSRRLLLTLQDDASLTGVPGPVQFPSPNAIQKDKRRLVSLAYDSSSPSQRLQATLYHSEAGNRYLDPDAYPAPINSDHRNQTTSADITSHWFLSSGQWSSGLSWRSDALDSSNVGHRYADNVAVFANAELGLGSLTLVPEWRKDWQSQFGSSESPSLGLLLKLSNLNSLTLNRSKAFRAPSFDDLYWPEDNFAVGNPNLRPELATGTDITWKGKRRSLSLFRTSAKNLILWQPVQGGKWSPSNVGRAVMEGLELHTEGRRDKWDYGMNYTFLHAFDATGDPVTGGKQLIGRPRHEANLRLTRRLGLCETTLQINATSERFYTSANTKSLGGYVAADLYLSRDIPWLGTLLLSINNLLDKNYQTVAGYPMPGREVRLRVSKSF
jgi:outer membrane cobalamin receptor